MEPNSADVSSKNTIQDRTSGWVELKNLDTTKFSDLPAPKIEICHHAKILKYTLPSSPPPSSPEMLKMSKDGLINSKRFDPSDSSEGVSQTSKIGDLEDSIIIGMSDCQQTNISSPTEIETLKFSVKSENSSTSAIGDGDPKLLLKKFTPFYGGDWIDLKKLDPQLVDLIYWRDVKKTGIVFGRILVILLSLYYFSLLSVLAHLSLAILCITFTFRIYKFVLQVAQKSNSSHPFNDIYMKIRPYLKKDITIPEETVQQATEIFIKHINSINHELLHLFLVEDILASLKFGVVLWVLTYIGLWFKGMTLIILAFVALFTLPKIYETYKAQIEYFLMLAHIQINNVTCSVKSKVQCEEKEKVQ